MTTELLIFAAEADQRPHRRIEADFLGVLRVPWALMELTRFFRIVHIDLNWCNFYRRNLFEAVQNFDGDGLLGVALAIDTKL